VRILIIGQAPGSKVHASGIPWDDDSGDRLREWMGVDKATFYDPRKGRADADGVLLSGQGGEWRFAAASGMCAIMV
jgi:uracil-DNA glycosylase